MPTQLAPAEIVWSETKDMRAEFKPLINYILLNYKSAPGFQFAVEGKNVFHKRIEKVSSGH